jgi:preprotein translocase subunit SecB
MQPSPLQLSDLFFVHSDVRPRIAPIVTTPPGTRERFKFSETVMTTTVEHAVAPDDEDVPFTNVLVTLQLILSDEGAAPSPYIVDVKCVGYFTISKKAFPDEIKRIDVAVVNAASLLYGTIREHLTVLTTRMWYGELLLPAVNFLQNAPSLTAKADGSSVASVEVAAPVKGRKRVSAGRTK